MTKKTSYIFIFTLLFLISIFILAGCNQENNEDSSIVNPTTEEKIEGTWFAGREPLELPSSYLILTSSGKAYLSTDGVKYSTLPEDRYEYNVYSGNYYISENNYLFLELTHYDYGVITHSGNAFEVFNTNLESYNNGKVKLIILEIKNNSLITIEEQPLKYTKMGG